MLESSPQSKDAEIVKLQKRIEYLEKNRENQEEVCQSLSEESTTLKQQLKELAEMCQHMAKKLEEKEQRSIDASVQKVSQLA